MLLKSLLYTNQQTFEKILKRLKKKKVLMSLRPTFMLVTQDQGWGIELMYNIYLW